MPQYVQGFPAQLAHYLRQPVQECGAGHSQLFRRRQGLVLDQGTGHVGFDELLQGILCVSGEVQVGMWLQPLGQAIRQSVGFCQLFLHGWFVVPMHSPDGQRARARELARLGQSLIAAGSALVEVLADLLGNAHQLMHAAPRGSSALGILRRLMWAE